MLFTGQSVVFVIFEAKETKNESIFGQGVISSWTEMPILKKK